MNKFIYNKGISLVALVVTIIIILILSGVTINILNDSIIERAELAVELYNQKTEEEKSELVKGELEISQYPSSELFLKGNVKVGDCINYPIEYNDAYSNVHYTGTDGWRVIDDGIMEGTSGSVKIISSHIPTKFLYDPTDYNNNVDNVIEQLTTNFEGQTFVNGFTGEQILGSYFKDNNLAKSVTTLTLENLNYAHNSLYGTERESNATTSLNENDELFSIKQMAVYYWIVSKQQGNSFDMYTMSQFGIIPDSDVKLGIRPVVILKDDLKGHKKDNLWVID